MTLKNDLYLRALNREAVEKTPVWIMRQAGRYLPEYRATRAVAGDFMSLCKKPELACEVTLQPLERFELDAAILFSDILTIPDAMGLGLSFGPGEGPVFEKTVRSEQDLADLKRPDMDTDLRYVMDATATIRKALDGRVPLIGFSGSPWTLACYMVEGRGSKDYRNIKAMAYGNPKLMHALLDTIADSVTDYLNAQIQSGAQAVQIFDTWGGTLPPAAYKEFSLHYMAKIASGLIREYDGRKVPVVFFTKGGGAWLGDIANAGCDAVGVDWTTDLSTARQLVDGKIALQGNLDPCTLYCDEQTIVSAVERTLASAGDAPGHVFNLGHGILPDVPPESVKILVDAVHRLSSK